MYTVLLADDEPSVLETTISQIPWEDFSLTVKYAVNTGKEAYDLILSDTPDIAILDIRMPGYSGLEISKQIQKQKLKTKVIIVSGYAEFSYAQKSMQYGVLGYCLKPVEYDELTSLLLKAVSMLKETPDTDNATSFLDAIEKGDNDFIKDFLKKQSFEGVQFYLASSLGTVPLPVNDALTIKLGSDQYVYLSEAPFDKYALLSIREDQHIGILPKPVYECQLNVAINIVLSMAYQSFISRSIEICDFYTDISDIPIFHMIQNALEFNDKPRLCALLHECLENAGLFSVQSAQQLFNSIILNYKIVENSQDYYMYSFKQLVHAYGSFEEMISSLIDIVEFSSESKTSSQDFSNSHLMKIMKYINTYYAENISLNDVASVVNLNPNYISSMFKKSVGSTFSQYLTKLRIENAKKLLKGTNVSISDVSVQSGFNDYFYFLKTFKKYTGETPSEYRNHSLE